jgi:hypothetical protein
MLRSTAACPSVIFATCFSKRQVISEFSLQLEIPLVVVIAVLGPKKLSVEAHCQ